MFHYINKSNKYWQKLYENYIKIRQKLYKIREKTKRQKGKTIMIYNYYLKNSIVNI